jgi:hypothetical protein
VVIIFFSSGKFLEGKNHFLSFPTIDPTIMKEIFEYLHFSHYHKMLRDLEDPGTQTKQNYSPPVEIVKELLIAAHYLDIPDMVSICIEAFPACFDSKY